MNLLFLNAAQVVTCAGPARARRGAEMRDAQVRMGMGVAVAGDRIAKVAPPDELEREYPDAARNHCARGVLPPGLVDSHTHAIFGRARYEEQEMRAAGVSYMEIATRGGGIHASVRDARARSEEELAALARARLERLASYGTTTVEVKSGYGLSVDDELKLLRAIAQTAKRVRMRVVPTWLGAHEIPKEYRERLDGSASYVKLLVGEMLPAVTQANLAKFADVFCEPGVFTPDQARTSESAATHASASCLERVARSRAVATGSPQSVMAGPSGRTEVTRARGWTRRRPLAASPRSRAMEPRSRPTVWA